MQHWLSFGKPRLFPPGQGRQGYESSSRRQFGVRTLTRGSPRNPNWLARLFDRQVQTFSWIDISKRCSHLLDCGRGLSMNHVQNGKSWSAEAAGVSACCARQLAEHSLSMLPSWISHSQSAKSKLLSAAGWQLALPNPRGSERRRKRLFSFLRPLAIQCSPSRARFSVSTFTPGSPRTPRSRPSVFCSINSRTLPSLRAARFCHARGLELGVAQTDVRIEAAAGCGDRVGRNGFVFFQAVLFSIGDDAVFDRIVQLLRSRSEIAAAGAGGVVAVAGSGRTRVKIFVGGEILAPSSFEPRTVPS